MSDADPDAPLVEALGRGDPAAVRRLVAAKLPRMLGLSTRLLGNRADAEDVAQEAFVRVWNHAGSWKPGLARFDTWLYTIVLNLCRDRLRRRPRVFDDAMPDIADASAGPEETLLATERERAVADAIGALPDRQREAILLVHYQDCAAGAAAAIMGISVEALESLLARGRRTLRSRLQPNEDGGSDG